MKFTLEKKLIEQATSACLRFVNPRSPLPALGHFLIDASSDFGTVTISATDLDIGLSTVVGANVDVSGQVVCPAKLLQEIISSLGAGGVSFKTQGGNKLSVSCGRSNFKLASFPVEEYPTIPDVAGSVTANISWPEFQKGIKQVCVAASPAGDEYRMALTGIRVEITQGDLILSATDGRRMAIFQKATQTALSEASAFSALVPAKALIELAKISSKTEALGISLDNRQAAFHLGDNHINCRLIEGSFPDWRPVYPKAFEGRCLFNRKGMLDCLKRVLILSQDKRSPNLIKVDLQQEAIEISSMTPELGSCTESIPCQLEGSPRAMGFNGRLLIDALNVIDQEEACLHLQAENKSNVLQGLDHEEYSYIVMPVRLRDEKGE